MTEQVKLERRKKITKIILVTVTVSEYHPDMQRTDCVQAGAAGRFSFYFPIIHQSHWRRSVCFSSVCSFQRGFINPAIYLICLSIFSFFEKFLCQVAVK